MKYQKFSQTNKIVILARDFVEISWSKKTAQRYINLGYEYRDGQKKFMCKVDDIPKYSRVKIEVVCPLCHKERRVRRSSISRSGHSYCAGCAQVYDLSGLRFGRLVAIKLDKGRNASSPFTSKYWLCKCDCGATHSVNAWNLNCGDVTSCGCYARDVSRSMCGENSPHWKEKPILICENCGEEYSVVNFRKDVSKFCSHKCRQEYNSGSNHYNWNSNISDEERYAGRHVKHKGWRKLVYEKDWYRCVCCGDKSGGNLVAHHLFDYSTYPEKRFDVENGVTLCRKCHKDFHIGFMGGYRASCTKEDFEKWVNLVTTQKTS